MTNGSNTGGVVLILSDGKPGHYNQSLGIMDRMRDVPTRTVEIRFRRKWRDDLLRLFVWLFGGVKVPHGVIRAMLRWALEGPSAEAALGARRFNAIVSTGSSLAAPNLLLGQVMNAKTIVCMRPSPVGIRHFDLAILPERMRPRRLTGNEVITIGVPNRITPGYVERAGAELAERLNITGRSVIGLLLGGDDRHYAIPPDMVSLLCDVLLDICDESGSLLALTTSRRTDPRSEEVVRSKLSNHTSCCLSVLASEPRCESPVPGILGISDVIIVTEDSFSMVCEAVSSGRKTAILEVERRGRGDQGRQRTYRTLAERGYARRASISNLKDVVSELLDDPSEPKVLDDAQIAADALRALIDGKC